MTDAKNPAVLVEREDKILVITLNRPENRNLWNREMLLAFEPVVDALHQDEDAHVVVLKGSGGEYFSWGAFDPAIRGAMDKNEVVEMVLRGSRLRDSLEVVPQLTICAINGKARGNGVELSLACDMRFVSDRSTIEFPEADMGGIPGGGGFSGPGVSVRGIVVGRAIVSCAARSWRNTSFASRWMSGDIRAKRAGWNCFVRARNALRISAGVALGINPSAS